MSSPQALSPQSVSLKVLVPVKVWVVTMVCLAFMVYGRCAWGQAPPSIMTPPQGVSVRSGVTVTFSVSVTGDAPLSFQWLFNGTNLPGATSTSLGLTNVSLFNHGTYALRVSNAYGMVTSSEAVLRVDDDLFFRILDFKTNGVKVVDVDSLIGDDHGGIAVSSNSVFLAGDNYSGRWGKQTLTSGARLSQIYDMLVTDLKTEKVWCLYNEETPVRDPRVITALVEFNDSGLPTANRIELSRPVDVSYYHVGIFAGYGRIVINVQTNAYLIEIPSGLVREFKSTVWLNSYGSETWADWGIAEYAGGSIYLVYAAYNSTIMRTRLPGGETTTVTDFENLGDMASITFSPSLSRWFFHHESSSQFRIEYGETLGSAKATFTRNPWFPMIRQDPAGVTRYAENNHTFSVSVFGEGGFSYQWYRDNVPIAFATNQTLTLTNLSPADIGSYWVTVENWAGQARSGAAYLDVVSAPRISYDPSDVSVFQYSNTYVWVSSDGAPPLSYQWWFNGTNLLAWATNASLTLTNIQLSQAGYYTLMISNRFGWTNTRPVEVFVSQITDDGSIFQVTSLQTNDFQVISTYDILNSDVEYGPLALSSNRVFFSGNTRTARANASDLGGLAVNSRYYYALISNLRTERVYVLGESNNVPSDDTLDLASTLNEIDSNTGLLTGNRVYLSMPIPYLTPMDWGSEVGFFSGYDCAVVLNGTRAYKIALPSGVVTDLGAMYTPYHANSYGGAFWGIAENAGGFTYLVYAQDSRNIVRVRVPDSQRSYAFPAYQHLSYYMSSITASIRRGRWYFQHNWDSQFAPDNYSTLGYATATFNINSGRRVDHFEWAAIPSPQRIGTPFQVTLYAMNTEGKIITNYSGAVTLQGVALPENSAVSIAPKAVSQFVNGTWTGLVTVLQASPNMVIRAQDADAHEGTSSAFKVVPENDLAIAITSVPDPVVLGQTLTYTLVLTNTGPLAAGGVRVTNQLGKGALFVSATPSQGSCSIADGVVHCDLGTVGESVQVTINVIPSEVGPITNYCAVSGSGVDPDPSNNAGTNVTLVVYPLISISDSSLVEQDSGTNQANFTVTLSPPSSNIVTVAYVASDGGASSNTDYVPISGLVAFSPGSTSQTVSVAVRGDTMYESDEQFYLTLSNPTNGTILRGQGIGTIVNNDSPPTINVTDVAVTEGNSGTKDVTFTISISAITGLPVYVSYFTSNGTASAGSDYAYKNGSISFGAESIYLTRTVSVQVMGDTVPEPNEVFYLALTDLTNAVYGKIPGVGTINNEDGLGIMDHFTWRPFDATQQLNTPFIVRLLAKDVSEGTITGFSNTVTFSGWKQSDTTNVMLGNVVHSESISESGQYTLGYSFRPNCDMRVTHARHYFGSKVSIWRDNGILLASQGVSGTAGLWNETPFDVMLSSNTTYRVGVYGDLVNGFYWITNGISTFPDGSMVEGYYGEGDSFPNYTWPIHWILVDLRYVVGTNTPISISPILSTNFSRGLYTDSIAVHEPGTNIFLQAEDSAGHIGRSSLFMVPAPFIDEDNDGMLDSWELLYDFNPQDPSDAALDSDNDGASNLEEFLAGTDPRSAAEVLQIISIQATGGVQIRFRGVTGKDYVLERSEEVGPNASWSPVTTFHVSTPGDLDLEDPLPGSGNAKFYRIRLVTAP